MSSAPHKTPGQFVEELLQERGWSSRVLALVLGTKDANIHHIISGRRAVDAEMAIALGEVFGLDPVSFLDLQQAYDLAKAKLTTKPAPERARIARIYGALPIAEMVKRGWLPAEDVRDIARVELGLERLFGAPAGEIPEMAHAAKKTDPLSSTTPAQAAWLHRVRQIARGMAVPRYSSTAMSEAIKKLSGLLAAAEEVRHVPRILAEAGVRFVIVEGLSKAKIDGACLWLNENSPVIGMTLRHDRIDNFWFTLRHECEHVIRGDGKAVPMLDVDLDESQSFSVSEEERAANAAASEFCVPKKQLESFIARKKPFFTDESVRNFATVHRIHPGLVAGQIRHRLQKWNILARHLVKVRAAVAPGAVVDGWGDIAPTEETL